MLLRKKERKTTQARPAWVQGAQSSSRTWVLGLCYWDMLQSVNYGDSGEMVLHAFDHGKI
jgi:hypothetical protein